jgi:hypothetical protein
MGGTEAFVIAREAILAVHALEPVVIGGKERMVPSLRKPNGEAQSEADQKAADAFNWFVDNCPSKKTWR